MNAVLNQAIPLLPREINNKNAFALLITVLLSRIPFLFFDFGSDGDAWRIAWSADTIWSEGIYYPSRFPGFPVFEFLNAPLIGLGGALLSNSFTLFIFLFCILIFVPIMFHVEKRYASMTIWTFAFTPLLWKNSTVTHDYILGLFLILLSTLFLFKNKFLLSGIFLGIAVGVRITHIVFLIPFIYFLISFEKKKNILALLLPALLLPALIYLPLFMRHLFIEELNNYNLTINKFSFNETIIFFFYRTVYSLGILGFLSILIGIFYKWRDVKIKIQQNKFTKFALSVILTGLILFLLSPDEREYLIPIFPFLFIMITTIYSRRLILMIYICILSYSFFNIDLIKHGFQNQSINPDLKYGIVIEDLQKRINVRNMRDEFVKYPLPDTSVVITGMGPILWFRNNDLKYYPDSAEILGSSEVAYFKNRIEQYVVYELPKNSIIKLKNQGFKIFYLSKMKSYIEWVMNIKVDDYNILPINITIP